MAAGKGTQEAKQLLTTPALSQTGEAVPCLTDSGLSWMWPPHTFSSCRFPGPLKLGVFLSDFYFCLFLFLLIMVPKAEGSILSTESHSCERTGCLSGMLPSPQSELGLSRCRPSTARTGVTSPRVTVVRHGLLKKSGTPTPRWGSSAPFTVDTPHLGRQSRATLPQPASCQPRREGGQTVGKGSTAPAVCM